MNYVHATTHKSPAPPPAEDPVPAQHPSPDETPVPDHNPTGLIEMKLKPFSGGAIAH